MQLLEDVLRRAHPCVAPDHSAPVQRSSRRALSYSPAREVSSYSVRPRSQLETVVDYVLEGVEVVRLFGAATDERHR